MGRDLSQAFALIRRFEGCRLTAYQDSVGVWTIGYGTTAGVTPGQRITQTQAEGLMEADVAHRSAMIESWVTVPCTDNMFSAMISLAYNIGLGAFYHSRLLTELNSGISKQMCAQDFLSWVHAGGRILPGLVTRRKAEAAVFLT